jgi:hypothetical protein
MSIASLLGCPMGCWQGLCAPEGAVHCLVHAILMPVLVAATAIKIHVRIDFVSLATFLCRLAFALCTFWCCWKASKASRPAPIMASQILGLPE